MRNIQLLRVCIATIVCLVSRSACQVDFTSHQRPQGLELLCSLGELQSISFTHLESLLIFKLTGSTRNILASISSHYGQDAPISHSPGAQVAGHFSNDDSLQSYLRIAWTDSETNLDGEYECDLNYVDQDYIPFTVTQNLIVQIQAPCPCFWASPDVLQVGLTKQLEILCSLPDPSSSNIAQLGSLEIIIIDNELKQVLAEINSMTGVPVLHASNDWASVNGSIYGTGAFLQVVWKYPTIEMAAEFACEGTGVGTNGNFVIFNRHFNVSFVDPDPRDLVDRLFEMYDEQKEYARCKDELEKLNNTHTPETSTQTPTEMNVTSPTLLPKTCDDLNLPPGEHVVTVYPNDGLGSLDVLCQAYGEGEVWTVFQKRFDGSLDFYRSFMDYTNGFGSVQGEFWMGLENTRRLLLQNGDNNALRIEVKELYSINSFSKTFPFFSLGPWDGYQLDVRGGAEDSGFGLSSNSGQNFSTYDHGYTMVADINNKAAGWWFPLTGGYVNINGKWGFTSGTSTMDWYEFRMSFLYPMGETKMMFRKNAK